MVNKAGDMKRTDIFLYSEKHILVKDPPELSSRGVFSLRNKMTYLYSSRNVIL